MSLPTKASKYYGQHHELYFIEHIGTHSVRGAGHKLSMLTGYLASLDSRTQWFHGVDVDALRRKAQTLIARHQQLTAAI